jgi:hypothetical protein
VLFSLAHLVISFRKSSRQKPDGIVPTSLRFKLRHGRPVFASKLRAGHNEDGFLKLKIGKRLNEKKQVRDQSTCSFCFSRGHFCPYHPGRP